MKTPSIRIAAVAVVLGLAAAACGDDDNVRSDVAEAADKVEEAAKSGDEKDIAEAEEAVQKADSAITDRLNTIRSDFDEAEAKFGDNATSAYSAYRNDLAEVETSAAAAVAALEAGDEAATEKAWNETVDKAKALMDSTAKADQQLDDEAQQAVDKLWSDLESLVKDIEAGLR